MLTNHVFFQCLFVFSTYRSNCSQLESKIDTFFIIFTHGREKLGRVDIWVLVKPDTNHRSSGYGRRNRECIVKFVSSNQALDFTLRCGTSGVVFGIKLAFIL